jgi:YidC/Oxa1 family membrane protein insertase
MKFDRNTILGFLFLAILLIGYLWYNSNENAKYLKQKAEQAKKDSIEYAKTHKADTSFVKKDSTQKNLTQPVQPANQFPGANSATAKELTVRNGVLKITFTSKGGQPKKVELLKYKGPDSLPVRLASSDFDKIDYQINTAQTSDYISNLNFKDSVITSGDSSTVIFTLGPDSTGETVQHIYKLKKDDYMVDFTVKMNRSDKLLSQGNLNFIWQYKAVQQESDKSFEKQNTQIGFWEDGDYDYHTAIRKTNVEFSKPVRWVGIRQRFFNTFLLAKNNFSSGKIDWLVPNDSTNTILQATANFQYKVPVQSTAVIPMQIFYGPADYHIINKYDEGFGKIINLGQNVYSFVRPLNKYIVMPFFDFVKSFAGSIGIAIALLTIFIRLITSPLMYPGYKTSAQMKVLRPDLAKLKEKYPDQQQFAMEQMRYLREAGVNQFAGCLPALVQIPIFFSLYSFFNASIDLRGQTFLWAKDLAAPDAVIRFGTHLPVIGDHISMFTLTAVATSFLISLYGMTMSPDQSNPVMKYMPYIFPFFLLFIFNNLPSALTWYYTISNLITLGLQYFIQNHVINHERILSKIEENRKKPKTKSKWQERMEQMQEQQKRMKEGQQKKSR